MKSIAAVFAVLLLCSSCTVSHFGANAYQLGVTYEGAEITRENAKTIYEKDGSFYVKANVSQYERRYTLIADPASTAAVCGKIYDYKKLVAGDPGRPGYYRLDLRNYSYQKSDNKTHWNAVTPYGGRWIAEKDFDVRSAKKRTDMNIDFLPCRQFNPVVVPVGREKSAGHYAALPLVVVGTAVDAALSPIGFVVLFGKAFSGLGSE